MTDLPYTPQYRACFMTDAGKYVLADLLRHCGYFDTDLKTTEEIAVQNFVKKILMNMGIVTTPDKIPEFVNAILSLKAE
jgi:hypothetical protein